MELVQEPRPRHRGAVGDGCLPRLVVLPTLPLFLGSSHLSQGAGKIKLALLPQKRIRVPQKRPIPYTG